MRTPPVLRRARQNGTVRMIEDARACVRRIIAAPAPQLLEATRHAARQLAQFVQAEAEHIALLPPHTSEAWIAAANLTGAAERVEAVTTSPEAWAGQPMLFEAQHLLGAVQAQRIAAQRAAVQRSKGGRATMPDSQAKRIRAAAADSPGATSAQIADAVGADDERYVRKVVAARKKRCDSPGRN